VLYLYVIGVTYYYTYLTCRFTGIIIQFSALVNSFWKKSSPSGLLFLCPKSRIGRVLFSIASLHTNEYKEVTHMKKHTLPVVHCDYTETGKNLDELLEESFRLYLVRILAASDKGVVQSSR
jgi:hypothetical protein